MQRLKNYRVVIHIKNHNLCIFLILFFLLGINISHIYNEESNVYLKIAATQGGQLWLTADIGFGNMIPVSSKMSAIRARWLGWRVEGGVAWGGVGLNYTYKKY